MTNDEIFNAIFFVNPCVFASWWLKKNYELSAISNYNAETAAMPGNVLPSKYSSIAPPPVDT